MVDVCPRTKTCAYPGGILLNRTSTLASPSSMFSFAGRYTRLSANPVLVGALITWLPESENAPGVFSTHPLPISTESGRLKASEKCCAVAAGTAASDIPSTVPTRMAMTLFVLIHQPEMAAWILFIALHSLLGSDTDADFVSSDRPET